MEAKTEEEEPVQYGTGGTTAYKRYYRSQAVLPPEVRYYRPACAQPRAFGLVSLATYPFVAKTINRPPPPPFSV